jgi:endoglucanase
MMKNSRFTLPSIILFAIVVSFASKADTIRFAGVNLSGAEFGTAGGGAALPGTFNSQYTYPNQSEVNYYGGRGMNIIRLPFRWERLQQSANANFDVNEFGRFNTFVSQTTAKGVYVILDPHNFQRYYPDITDFNTMQSGSVGLVGSAVPDSVFTNFWFRLADIYKTNDHVIFNLMNEPNAVSVAQLVTSENAAIASIRAAGATNLIFVPGDRWTGAWTWLNSDGDGPANSVAMLGIIDPANNYAFDVHQYLDSNGSGGSTNIVRATIGMERLTNFTAWCRANNQKGFLGEFAVANNTIGSNPTQIGDETLTNMLGYIQANADVWLGWSWWGGGPWWGSYMFTLEPTSLTTPVDRPTMPILRGFIPIPAPPLALISSNQFRFTAQLGFSYQPQLCSDLSAGVWSNLGSSINGNGLSFTVTMNTASGDAGFYRVRVTKLP